jgi:hypothetical protein
MYEDFSLPLTSGERNEILPTLHKKKRHALSTLRRRFDRFLSYSEFLIKPMRPLQAGLRKDIFQFE